MPNPAPGPEAPESFFYELVADPQAPAPASLDLEQAEFVRLAVEVETAQSHPAGAASPDFKRIWQHALSQAEEVKAAGPDVSTESALATALPLSKKPFGRPVGWPLGWPMALVAVLLVTVLAGLVVLLVVTQPGLDRPAATSVADTSTPPPTSTPIPKPSFNGVELPYPGATSLATPSDLWFRNYPAGAISNPAQLAFSTADKAGKILDYYRQKLAGYTDYLEERPANPTQFYDGLVAFKGDTMLVINALEASKRSSFHRDSTFFKLFKQMTPDQTLLIISYGPAPNLSSLPDFNLAGSVNLTNYDFNNWPDLTPPFDAFNNYVIIRPTQKVQAVPAAFPDVVNQYKATLLSAGYTIWYSNSNDVKTCDSVCQKNGWEVIVASRDSRLVVMRIYGPARRNTFQPTEIQNLTAQGLKSEDTLVGYWTGLDDSYMSASRPIPDMRTASLAWAPDASFLAISKNNEVQLWKDGTSLSTILENFSEPVYKLAWSPDSQTLAIASGYGIQFWSVQSGKLTPFAPSHTATIKDLAWSPDGKRLASSAGCLNESSSSCDEQVFLWQPNGSLVAILPGHQGSPNALLWSPDSQQLATEQNDAKANNLGAVRIWDSQGQPLRTLDAHPVFAANMAWWPGPDSHILVTGPTPGLPNPGLSFWDTDSGWLARGLPATLDTSVPTRLAFSPDGTTLAVTSNATVQLWQYSTGQLINTLSGHTGPVNDLAWSPDGKYLATAGQDGNIRLWYKAGKPLTVMSSPSNPLVKVSWSPTSTTLYAITTTGDLWYSDGTILKGGLPNMRQDLAAWLPNSDKLALFGIDGLVSLWDNKGYGTTSYYP